MKIVALDSRPRTSPTSVAMKILLPRLLSVDLSSPRSGKRRLARLDSMTRFAIASAKTYTSQSCDRELLTSLSLCTWTRELLIPCSQKSNMLSRDKRTRCTLPSRFTPRTFPGH
ncbi:MAG TPA: hypothetical protein V6C85_24175 [Allocoleopsis sp.]